MAAAGNAGIIYVGGRTQAVTASTTDQTISLTSLSGGVASAPATGDLVIAYLGVGSTAFSARTISGYTRTVSISADDTFDTYLGVYYKFMGATPDTSLVITGGTASASNAGAIAVEVWRNVDSILPFDVTTTTATGINSVLCNPPAITPVTPGAIIVAGGAGAHNQSTATFSSSDLTAFLSSGGNSTNDVTIGLGYKVWESGAFDPAAFTFSGSDSTNFSWAAATLALYPTQGFTGTVPTFVASATASSAGSATTLTVNKPTGTVAGHLMVAFFSTSAGLSATFTTPAGWTEVADSSGSVFNQCLAYKVAGASEGADYTFTCSASGDMSGAIATFSSAAYDITGAFSSLGSTVTFSAPSITTQTYPSVLLAFGAAEIGSSQSVSLPTDMTNVAARSGELPIRIAAQTVRVGATGTRSFTVSSGTDLDGTRAILAAIKPA